MNFMPKKLFSIANQITTALFYISFCVLILILLFQNHPMVWKTLLICGVSFCAVSAFRHFYNAPRPYEKNPTIKPPTPHCKKGHSFPSRHVFCAFLIASTTVYFCPRAGWILFIPAVFLAFLRRYLHYHSTKDVLCGAVLGIFCAALGFGLFV